MEAAKWETESQVFATGTKALPSRPLHYNGTAGFVTLWDCPCERSVTMAEDHVLTDEELQIALRGLPDWELRDRATTQQS